MEKTNHPVDNIFIKGLEDYKMNPSPEIKKKVFASPGAIKPIKPWYMGINGLYIAGSVIATASLIIYFGLFYGNQTVQNIKINKNISANTISKIENANIQDITKTNNEIITNNSEKNNSVSNNSSEKIQQSENIKNKKSENINSYPKQNPDIDKNTSNSISDNIKNSNSPRATNQNSSVINENSNSNVNPEKNIANSLAEEKTTSELTNNSFNSKGSINFKLSSNKNVESTTNDNTSPVLLMEKRTILLSSEQLAEYIKLISEKPAHYRKGLWFAEFKAGVLLSNYKVTASNEEWKPASDAKQEMLKPSQGFEMGVNAVYQQKRWIIKGGLNYVNYGEKLTGKMFLSNPYNDTSITYNGGYYETIINGIYYDIDSTSYFHYTYTQTDHIFVDDSTLAWNTQNRPVDVLDTTNVTKIDTLPKTTINNSIKYVEIPFSAGYVFPFGRFSFTVSASVAPGYFVAVRGSQMNTENYPAIEPYSKNTIKKFTLSAGAALEFGYNLNETWMFGAESFYRKSLLGIYNNENKINQTGSHYGIKLSIKKIF